MEQQNYCHYKSPKVMIVEIPTFNIVCSSVLPSASGDDPIPGDDE